MYRSNDLARASGCAARSLRRFQRRFEEGGLVALEHRTGFPRGRSRLRASRLSQVRQWRADGASNRQIAGKLGVREPAVRKLLRRVGFKAAPPRHLSVFPAEPELDVSADRDPLDRSGDRLLAHLRLLNDAVQLFASGERLPHAGVPLAVPAILYSRVVDCAREVYDCVGPAYASAHARGRQQPAPQDRSQS